jgi:hypothetical protein
MVSHAGMPALDAETRRQAQDLLEIAQGQAISIAY